mmetsp:Transcript_144705/g.463714  ORF Transcript_144705/g.463714 Transcript_144705/m.463714 type:complete len:356 (+) Transcript_144705:87-1154(+)
MEVSHARRGAPPSDEHVSREEMLGIFGRCGLEWMVPSEPAENLGLWESLRNYTLHSRLAHDTGHVRDQPGHDLRPTPARGAVSDAHQGRSRLVFGRRHQPPPERARPGRTTARGPRSLLRAARGRLPALQKVGHPLPRARASATAPATAASEASTRHRLRAAAPPRPRAHAPSSTARRPAPTAPVAAAASMWQRRRSMGATRRRRGRQCLRWVPHRRPRGARFEKPADDDLRTRGDGFGARAAQTDHTSLASASVTTSGLRNRTAAFGQQAAGTTQGQQRSPTLAGSGGSGSTLGQRMEEAQQKVARKAVNGYVSHATGGLVKNVPPSVSNSALSHAKKNPQDAMRFAKFATKAM